MAENSNFWLFAAYFSVFGGIYAVSMFSSWWTWNFEHRINVMIKYFSIQNFSEVKSFLTILKHIWGISGYLLYGFYVFQLTDLKF